MVPDHHSVKGAVKIPCKEHCSNTNCVPEPPTLSDADAEENPKVAEEVRKIIVCTDTELVPIEVTNDTSTKEHVPDKEKVEPTIIPVH